ncbi:MAG: phosphate ABC transporter substrate-binding protein PstS [Victivallaceae bacterium]
MKFKKLLTTLALGAAALAGAAEITLNGAGATFPSPVYRVWTYNFSQLENGKILVNYQGLGSGAGINQIKAGTVDFAGTDNPLTAQELKEAGLFQFPMLTGAVVVIVNLPGVKDGEVKLDQKTLADIFLGKIAAWNDPAIAALNPEVKLPRLKITVVRRSDSSGTTFIFTNYLAKISAEWKDKVGCGPAVNWPVGIAGQKNPGVCNNVSRIPGAIGYTEYTYALEAKIATVKLKNQAGKFLAANTGTIAASSLNADWKNAPGFYMVLTDQPGDNSWPITGVTYILIKAKQPDKAKCDALFAYFDWCFTTGANAAEKLNYVGIPPEVIELIKAERAKAITR